MLRACLGVQLACTVLETSPLQASTPRVLPSLGWVHQTPSLGSARTSRPLVPRIVHLAYLDGMQKCRCMNAEEATHDAFKRHTRHPRGHNERCKHLESKPYNITQTYHARITRRQH